MPIKPTITADDIQAELDRLDTATERFPVLRILTEQAPPEDYDPQAVGLIDNPPTGQ